MRLVALLNRGQVLHADILETVFSLGMNFPELIVLDTCWKQDNEECLHRRNGQERHKRREKVYRRQRQQSRGKVM